MTISMKISPATAKNKKYKAVFSHNVDGKKKVIKTTNFGDSRYSDYLQHKDKDRRTAYRKRHQKDLKTRDYKRAGHLSYHILWGESSSLRSNISAYKKRFKLR